MEIRTGSAVKYTVNPMVIEGHLAVLYSAMEGLFYRIADGALVD
jgi:hypothetical protein